MKMRRHYFISDNLDDLDVFTDQLENAGLSSPQIHVLSQNDSEVAHHHRLHDVNSFMKVDIVHSTACGAMVGFIASVLVLFVSYIAGWTESAAGWMPFIFLAVVVLGFCTWEGGLFGIQRPNHHFKRFKQALDDGKNVFFVDLAERHESLLVEVLKSHPQVQNAGTGASTPSWFIQWQKSVPRFFRETFP